MSEPLESAGLRALAFAVGELGVVEASPRVQEYRAGCVRGGRPLALTTGPWCAAFVGWCEAQAGVTGLPWRAAVFELCRDAFERGLWVALGGGLPLPGDLAIFRRDGQDPKIGGAGHVARVERIDGIELWTIDGNHNDAVARVHRRLDDSALVGWMLLPKVTIGASTENLARGAVAAGLDRAAREALDQGEPPG